MAADIITRAGAKSIGLKRYFTGKPCKHGHICERITANGVCLECSKEIERRYVDGHRDAVRAKWSRWTRNNRDKQNEKQRKWEVAHPEQAKAIRSACRTKKPELYRAIEKKWRAANPEKIQKKNKSYKATHKERLAPINLARVNQWRTDNPERSRENARKGRHTRRARQYEAGGTYTNAEIRELLIRQDFTCVYCPTSLKNSRDRELDHRVPIARGGRNDIGNLQWLCVSCNRRKRDKDPVEWALEVGYVPLGA